MNELVQSRITLTVLAICAAVSLLRGIANANLETGSTDFQYSAVRLLLEGVNAYDLYPVDPDRFLLTQGPNYLPLLYFGLLPIGALDWPEARLVWSLVNAALGLFVAARIAKGLGLALNWPRAGTLAALLFICSTPFRNTLGNGQHGLLVTAALIVALETRPALVRGLMLAIAATKLSLGAIFVALFGIVRRWAAVLIAGAVTLVSFATFGAMTDAPSALATLSGPVRAVRAGITYYPPHSWLVGTLGVNAAIAMFVACVAGFFLLGVRTFRHVGGADSGPIPNGFIFLATLLALASAPHAIYDYVILALPFTAGNPLILLSRAGQCLLAALLSYVMAGQKALYALMSAAAYDATVFAAWFATVLLALDCARRLAADRRSDDPALPA